MIFSLALESSRLFLLHPADQRQDNLIQWIGPYLIVGAKIFVYAHLTVNMHTLYKAHLSKGMYENPCQCFNVELLWVVTYPLDNVIPAGLWTTEACTFFLPILAIIMAYFPSPIKIRWCIADVAPRQVMFTTIWYTLSWYIPRWKCQQSGNDEWCNLSSSESYNLVFLL